MEIQTIIKENIPDYTIIPAEEQRADHWKEQLNYAVRLGNEYKSKTVIVFNTTVGPCQVETTVWSLTENYIVLKSGILIPLESIIDIHF